MRVFNGSAGIFLGRFLCHRPVLLRVIASLSFLLASPAFAQTLGRGSDDGISLWRVLAALILCLILAAAAAFATKTGLGRHLSFARPRSQTRKLVLVETLRLSHQIDICIVDCEDRRILLAAGAQGVQFLDRLPPDAGNDPAGTEHRS